MIDSAEVTRRFTGHEVSEAQRRRMLEIREEAHTLADVIVATTPEGREQSTAITKLEEVVFWANAAISRG